MPSARRKIQSWQNSSLAVRLCCADTCADRPLCSLAEADDPQDTPPVELGVGVQLGSPGGQRPQQVCKLGGRPQLEIPCQDPIHGHPCLQPSIALHTTSSCLVYVKESRMKDNMVPVSGDRLNFCLWWTCTSSCHIIALHIWLKAIASSPSAGGDAESGPYRVGHASKKAHNFDAVEGCDEAAPGVGRLPLLDLLAPLPPPETPCCPTVPLLRHLRASNAWLM